MPRARGEEVDKAVCEAVIKGVKAAGREGRSRGCGSCVWQSSAAMRARAEAREVGEGSTSMSDLSVVRGEENWG